MRTQGYPSIGYRPRSPKCSKCSPLLMAAIFQLHLMAGCSALLSSRSWSSTRPRFSRVCNPNSHNRSRAVFRMHSGALRVARPAHAAQR